MTSVTARVPAKINLQLAVGPLRADGYHGLVTVFHAISLFDEVTVAAAAADSVTVAGEGADHVPANGDNLALRAVRALREAIAARDGAPPDAGPDGQAGVAVSIRKRIPVAGGLAGGSADAAAALVACNELWQAESVRSRSCARWRPASAATWRSRSSAGPPSAAAGASSSPRPSSRPSATTGCWRSPTATCPPRPCTGRSTGCAATRRWANRSSARS